MRGPDRATLSRELAVAEKQVAELGARIAGLETELEREARRRFDAEVSIDRLNSRTGKAERRARVSAYRLQAVVYASLYRVPADRLPYWAIHWATDDPGAFHGEFSPRRPYLLHQRVRDEGHGVFITKSPVSPSRLRPHRSPERWERADESDADRIAPRQVTVVDEWRFGLAAEGGLAACSEEDLREVIAQARAAADQEWFAELNTGAHMYPCPANAYLTGRQWLEDMPGFRTAAGELRRRVRSSGGR